MQMIPAHHQPALFQPENAMFDHAVAHLHIRSEHCMGALKGWFQCLWGLWVNINNTDDHKSTWWWITVAIILHNLVIELEGDESGVEFATHHTPVKEREDHGEADTAQFEATGEGEHKRKRLIAELLANQSE